MSMWDGVRVRVRGVCRCGTGGGLGLAVHIHVGWPHPNPNPAHPTLGIRNPGSLEEIPSREVVARVFG